MISASSAVYEVPIKLVASRSITLFMECIVVEVAEKEREDEVRDALWTSKILLTELVPVHKLHLIWERIRIRALSWSHLARDLPKIPNPHTMQVSFRLEDHSRMC